MTLTWTTVTEPEVVLAEGTMVDELRVVRLVGRGGMGEVYLARDTKLGRKVALKLIRPRTLGSGDAVARFMREAQLTASFSHPNIVTVYRVGEHEGRPYLALEFLEGQNLRQRLQEERPGVREAVRIGLAIAQALAEAHRHRVLHRDLKPENVLLAKDGGVRVLDLGLAKALEDSGEVGDLAIWGSGATSRARGCVISSCTVRSFISSSTAKPATCTRPPKLATSGQSISLRSTRTTASSSAISGAPSSRLLTPEIA
ncbi:MAG: serine/threonine-protein kinase [Pseudomonadota bacterium]